MQVLPQKLRDRLRLAYRNLTAHLRSLPDTVIIGTQKGGTTSLFNYICQHPNVGRSTTKEVHYFDAQPNRSRHWYRSHFPYRGENERVIEATPRYLFNEEACSRIQETLPEAKLIAILREPVSRLFSHYKHACRGMGGENATETRPLEEAVKADLEVLKQGHVLGRGTYYDRYFSYVRRGIYAPQVERYLSSYGDNLLVLRSRALLEEPRATMERVFAYLELSSHPIDPRTLHNRGTYDDENPLRDDLTAFYRPHNQRLYDLLDVDAWWE
jgi:hypothetical protein